MIHRNVFHNEELKDIEKVRWSPGQAGLICGWGLFTTVRIVRGEAFAYERHWRRLEKDAALTRLPLTYTGAKVRVHLQEVIRANRVDEGCARIYLVWNTVGSWKSDEKMADVDLVITTAGVPAYPETVRLTVREHGRHAAAPLAGVKTISWLNSVWAVAEAQREGFDEVVLLNERGEVSECTAANIFAVKGDKVLTPSLNSGCLEGVTRGGSLGRGRRSRHRGSGTDAAAGRFVQRGGSVHHLHQPQCDCGARDRRAYDCRWKNGTGDETFGHSV